MGTPVVNRLPGRRSDPEIIGIEDACLILDDALRSYVRRKRVPPEVAYQAARLLFSVREFERLLRSEIRGSGDRGVGKIS
jgi:hypothetical protein